MCLGDSLILQPALSNEWLEYLSLSPSLTLIKYAFGEMSSILTAEFGISLLLVS